MYNHNDLYLKFCILRSIVLTIQNVCRLDFLQVPRRRCGENTITSSKRLLSFQNEQLFVFNDKQSTQYFKKTFWFDGWNVLDTVLNRIWNLLIVFRCNLDFTQMVFDSRLQLCDQWNTAYNRKRKQEHFWIILWRVLELLKGNKSQKTNPVTWQYNCLHWVLTV